MIPPAFPLSRVREFNFADHHVAPGFQGTEVVQVARALIGLHSARLPTPYMSLASRLPSFLPQMLRERQYETRTLVKLRCMRRTLHTVPLDLAPIVHRATLDLRMMDLRARLRGLGATSKALERTAMRIREIMDTGAQPASTIVLRTVERQRGTAGDVAAVLLARLSLKYLWEMGELTYHNRASHWAREERWFESTSVAYPSLRLNELDEVEARRKLVSAYIDRFGPVTERDIVWWSGLRVVDVRTAIRDLADELAVVSVTGLHDSCYMSLRSLARLDTFKPPARQWVRFLAYEDPSLKGYFESRARYLSPDHVALAFNSIGEVLPCVMIGGELVGRWSWDSTARRVRWAPFVPRSKLAPAIERERVHFEEMLRSW
ncbi:MAG: winged helix DNA-binding domain-containing protein [Pseudomonadota bacterium]|nr:winged helix DNA-binding domain-containing protein [Pseudomonadota bacterium]